MISMDCVRKNYPITREDVYLNHAATSPVSVATYKRMQALAAKMQRPLSEHFYAWLGILEDTRRRVAELIGAHPSEIAFCQNTSTALSLIANAIPFATNDVIIVPRNEFPSNIYVWQSLSKKGVFFKFFDVESGVPIVETLQKINLQHVRLLSISAVSYLTGRLYELNEIVEFCHAHNILVCLDAIQAIGTVPVNVKELNVDFLASGAQKWLLGSIGAGFVYAKPEWLEKLSIPLVGWASVKYPEDFSLKELDFSTEMTRFEPGLPDILPIAALNESLRELAAYGWETIFTTIAKHTTYLTQRLNEIGIETFAQRDQTAGIVSFTIPKALDINAFTQSLQKKRIHLTLRQNYIRIAPHFYSTQHELNVFLSLLTKKSLVTVPYKLDSRLRANESTKQILLVGATGILGKAFANLLTLKGYTLTLIGRSENKLNLLIEVLNQPQRIDCEIVDLNNPVALKNLIQKLKAKEKKWDALINCAGMAEADEFLHLPVEKLNEMLQVNCVATFQLMQAFLSDLKAEKPLGILNIISASGRCGSPLLSGYATSQGALWSLSEVIGREVDDKNLTVTTYIAPPMHSRMQKRLGRMALRYFKLSGDFPYKQATEVATEAWQAFQKKKKVFVSRDNRKSLLLNALIPSFINKKIRKIWKV